MQRRQGRDPPNRHGVGGDPALDLISDHTLRRRRGRQCNHRDMRRIVVNQRRAIPRLDTHGQSGVAEHEAHQALLMLQNAGRRVELAGQTPQMPGGQDDTQVVLHVDPIRQSIEENHTHQRQAEHGDQREDQCQAGTERQAHHPCSSVSMT